MNPLAQKLLKTLSNTIVEDVLSDYGKRIYFPKGIISQTAEASKRAYAFDATIGVATYNGNAMGLNSIYREFNHELSYNDLFSYAPTAGIVELREMWLNEMREKNPSLQGVNTSLPIVTSGLTHSINIAASLFVDKGDAVITSDMYWGNYNLAFTEMREAHQLFFPLFDGDSLNIEKLEETIDSVEQEKVFIILNFPNNPTGFTPTLKEAHALVEMLVKKAEGGKKLVIFTDDAYFGLFFEEESCKESLFALLANAHHNILAIKGDAATKEVMVWGFRIGFLTFNSKDLTTEHYDALENKCMGLIRGGVSSSSKPAQTVLLKGMQSPSYKEEKRHVIEEIEKRYRLLKEALKRYKESEILKPLPFNSGYFMAFEYAGDSEKLRVHLLDNYGVGTISIKNRYLRVAFSSINAEQIEELIDIVYKGSKEVLAL